METVGIRSLRVRLEAQSRRFAKTAGSELENFHDGRGSAVRLAAVLRRAIKAAAQCERASGRTRRGEVPLQGVQGMRRPRACERIRVVRVQHQVAGRLLVGTQQPPAILEAKKRRIDDFPARKNMVARFPRTLLVETIDDAAILLAHFRRTVRVRRILKRIGIRDVAIAHDGRLDLRIG